MWRKEGTLLPLELSILDAGLEIQGPGSAHFHGFLLAKVMREQAGARRLTAYGTLYKVLDGRRTPAFPYSGTPPDQGSRYFSMASRERRV